MNKLFLASTLLLCSAAQASAAGAPILGNTPADAHQLCGKTIEVQVKYLPDGKQIIGLMNSKSGDLDLFQSTTPQSPQGQYLKFVPIKYDQLSKNFIVQSDDTLDILWGRTENEKKEISYALSLGSHVYPCGIIQKWPNEKANMLYGEGN